MSQNRFFTGKIGRCLIVLPIFVVLAAILSSSYHFSSTLVVEAQGRLQQKRSRPKPKSGIQTQVKTGASFAGFKHESHREPKTKLNCSNCHTIPEKTAPDVIAATTKPTIKGYPYHDSCLGCHRQTPPQFFRGTTPSICTVCHTRSSPRLTARDVNPFPKQNEQAIVQEFPGYYPHDHRDHKRVNCATCHLTDERSYIAITVAENETPYKPPEGTFKTSPSGHAACFKCHWEEKPTDKFGKWFADYKKMPGIHPKAHAEYRSNWKVFDS